MASDNSNSSQTSSSSHSSDSENSSSSSSQSLTTTMNNVASVFEKGVSVEGGGAIFNEALDRMEADETAQSEPGQSIEPGKAADASIEGLAATMPGGSEAEFEADIHAALEEVTEQAEGEAVNEVYEEETVREAERTEAEEGLEEGELPSTSEQGESAVVYVQRSKREKGKGYFGWKVMDRGIQLFPGQKGIRGRPAGRHLAMDALSTAENQFVSVPHPLFKRREDSLAGT